MPVPLHHVAERMRWRAGNAGLFLAGGALVTVGAAFLVSALWGILARAYGPELASAIIGGVLVGLGLIVMALRRAPPPPPPPPLPSQKSALPPLMDAFLLGFSTWMTIRNATRRRRRY